MLDGKKNIIHTFSLKGKDQGTLQNYFKILCKKTKVHEKNLFILEETKKWFD
jgi:hypothetical protein